MDTEVKANLSELSSEFSRQPPIEQPQQIINYGEADIDEIDSDRSEETVRQGPPKQTVGQFKMQRKKDLLKKQKQKIFNKFAQTYNAKAVGTDPEIIQFQVPLSDQYCSDSMSEQNVDFTNSQDNNKCCNCGKALKLKIERELDRLNGEFRKKEQQYIKPLINRFERLELQMKELKDIVYNQSSSLKQTLQTQEQTITEILDAIQSLMNDQQITPPEISEYQLGEYQQSVKVRESFGSMPDECDLSLVSNHRSLNDRISEGVKQTVSASNLISQVVQEQVPEERFSDFCDDTSIGMFQITIKRKGLIS